MRFVHDFLPQRVCFGSGEAATHLEHEVAALGASRVMAIANKRKIPLPTQALMRPRCWV